LIKVGDLPFVEALAAGFPSFRCPKRNKNHIRLGVVPKLHSGPPHIEIQ
jgi:hypothetical protein